MNLFTEGKQITYSSFSEDEIAKKYEKIPECQYNSGVSCELKGRKCAKCGFNPIVSELRIQAIKLGDTHFLRFTDRYYVENKGTEHDSVQTF